MDVHAQATLLRLLGHDRLATGEAVVRDMHARFVRLIRGELRYGPGDDFYAGYFLYYLTPSLEAIAQPDWPERHLHDFALLAESPALAGCCRATALELFGLPAFHVTVQFNPCADGMVQRLCHDPGDRRDHAKQIARDVMRYSEAFGPYPPPGCFYSGTRLYTATDSGILDLGNWSAYGRY